MATENLITEHLDLWTAAIKRRSVAGRGSSSKVELYGLKRLRKLILQLAVRGLLVPQDPKDEPANELLKKIGAEKARLIKEGKIKKEKPLPQVGDEEKPFPLPKGWQWCRMADLAIAQAGFAFKSNDFNEVGEGLPLIRIRDVGQTFSGTYYKGDYREEFLVRNGDYLISMDGNFRVAPWAGEDALLNQRVSRLLFHTESVAKRFLAESLQLRLFELEGVKAYTTVDHLSGSQISESVVALPPLAEQHRIVAKVDALMALCDQLEQQTDVSLSAHQTLVETLLNALTSAVDHVQFANAWQRIAEHFNTLFATEESIDQLKQTVLQLAVMGKLVPQDPNDEPASELLKRIAIEKAKLVKEGTIKNEKLQLQIDSVEKPFELPSGWSWTRLSNISDIQSGIAKGKKYQCKDVVELPYLRVANVQRGYLDLDEIKTIEILESERERYSVRLRDLLITEGGDWDKVGRTAIWSDHSATMLHQNHVFKARLVLPEQNEFWLEKYLNGPFARDYFAGSSKQTTNLASINKTQLSNIVLPIPPLAEQHRIVAKVDELMALCDQLKAGLSLAEQLRGKLVDAVINGSLNPPSAKIIPFPDAAAREARRYAVGCHVVATLKSQRTFGRTVLMKLLYLADTHVAAELAMEPKRAARGPFDSWIYDFEKHAKAAGWFDHEETQGERNKTRYLPQTGLAAQAAKVHELLDASRAAELDRVLKLFADLSTEEAEIVATLFAAWNDFLIDGHTPDDAEVITEVRENWASEKRRFSIGTLQTWLDWMRKKKLVPRGLGPRTVQQGQLFH